MPSVFVSTFLVNFICLCSKRFDKFVDCSYIVWYTFTMTVVRVESPDPPRVST